MVSLINPGIITGAPVSKTDMAQQLTYARDEISGLQDDSTVWCGTAGGTANAITLTPSPAATAYYEGMSFAFKAAAENTSTMTVAVSGLLAVAINKGSGSTALRAGDIVAGGIVRIRHNGTNFVLESCTYDVAQAQRALGSAITRYTNRIANPTFAISQERGAASVDVTTGLVYAIDQWAARLSSTPGGTLRLQQVTGFTPLASQHRLRATAQVADASIAAGDFYTIEQSIEGLYLRDALSGIATSRSLLITIGIRSSIAGTFGISLTNSANNRSWVSTFTVSPSEVNTDISRRFSPKADTTGTWLVDNGVGLQLRICLAAGTTFQGSSGAWQAGNLLTTSAQTNFMGTGAATFELFDVSLYIDSFGAGVFPAWQPPDYHEDFARCQRYWENGVAYNYTAIAGVTQVTMSVPFRAVKRAVPVISGLAGSHSAGAITVNEFQANAVTAILNTPWAANARF